MKTKNIMNVFRGIRAARTACALVFMMALGLAIPAGAFQHPQPPTPPSSGEPGGAGPCGMQEQVIENPAFPKQKVWIFSPSGPDMPKTGGTCDDNHRPAIFIAPGFFGITPQIAMYPVIRHLVSNGHIVIFANYWINLRYYRHYDTVDSGFQAGAQNILDRIDLDNIGFLGHSFGAGMIPAMVQRAAARGWGSESLWAVMMAPWYSYQVGSGPIDLPAHTLALVINFDEDVVVDARIGIELFHALNIPYYQKQHLMIRSEIRGPTVLIAEHLTPTPLLGTLNSLEVYGILRPLDIMSSCARTGMQCEADLGFMGIWSDGVPARRALSTDNPIDLGPVAIWECSNPLNLRGCP